MTISLTQAFLLAFIFTGILSTINSAIGKLGIALGMLVMSLICLATGLFLQASLLWIIPAVGVCIFSWIILPKELMTTETLSDAESDPKLVSDRMLAEMDRNVAERKQKSIA